MDSSISSSDMKTKKSVVVFVILSLVFALLFPGAAFCGAFLIPSQFDETYLAELPYKIRRLEANKDRKKIVVVGGSSVPFSIRSSLMEKQLSEYTVIDFGLYADLGSKVMLDMALPFMKENDILVFSPELHSQMFSDYFSPSLLWQAFDGNYSFLNYVALENRMEMISSIPEFTKSKFSYWTSSKPVTGDIYMRSSFDEYGDISSSLPSGNAMDGFADLTRMISFDASLLDADYLSYLNSYYKKIREKGAKMYYRFAPMNNKAIENPDGIDAFYETLSSLLDFPIMGNPHDSVLDALWFYDTNYHLNNSGSIYNTIRFIKDIKLELMDDSKTDVEVPVAPLPIRKEYVRQNDEDISFFRIEEGEDSCSVIGLTDEGRKREKLVIPSMYKDKPVVSFLADVFSGSAARRVTVQDNIRELADGCFHDVCEVVLTNSSPSSLKVGTELMKGSSAKIFVSDDVLSKYKTDYTWSMYSQYLYPESALNQ